MAEKIKELSKKVFVAMSGGVDSSVAALLLKNQGYGVVGVFMKNWAEPLAEGEKCQWESDQQDARAVAAVLKIPLYTFDFSKEYKKAVADYMIAEYKAGRTPNPDVMCNKEIKFGLFLKRALKLGADFVATGHYARLRREFPISNFPMPAHAYRQAGGRQEFPIFRLFQAKDKNKDQSYFLWTLRQEQLKYCLFPIGGYLKSEVRAMAKKAGLPTADKKDSQGVCFVGKFDFADFLKKKIKPRKGKIIDADTKKIIGEHDGIYFYTIGQRHGIGLKGGLEKGGGSLPYYVCGKDPKKNILYVARENSKALYSDSLVVKNLNWISGSAPKFPLACEARIRYRQPLQKARVMNNELRIKSGKLRKSKKSIIHNPSFIIHFKEPQRAVAPGQSVVFYAKTGHACRQAGEMLGGGIIA